MRLLDTMQTIFATIASHMAASRRASGFTCADCDRNERCGLLPDDNCIARAEQISRAGDYRRMAPHDLYKAVWPR